jgi:hypothetical protein
MKQIKKYKKDPTYKAQSEGEEDVMSPQEMLEKPRIIRKNKLFEEVTKIANDQNIKKQLDTFKDEKLRKYICYNIVILLRK